MTQYFRSSPGNPFARPDRNAPRPSGSSGGRGFSSQEWKNRWTVFRRHWHNSWRQGGANITGAIIALNVTVWIVTTILGTIIPVLSVWFNSFGALTVLSTQTMPWTLLTSTFMHAGFFHLLFNMFTLWYVGSSLEKMLGHWPFLALYLISALGASVAFVAWGVLTHNTAIATVGASGAIFGIMGALFTAYNRIGVNMQSNLPMLIIMLVVPIFFGNVAWQAHLGGFITGAALSWLLMNGFAVWRRVSIAKRISIYGSVITAVLVGVWSVLAYVL